MKTSLKWFLWTVLGTINLFLCQQGRLQVREPRLVYQPISLQHQGMPNFSIFMVIVQSAIAIGTLILAQKRDHACKKRHEECLRSQPSRREGQDQPSPRRQRRPRRDSIGEELVCTISQEVMRQPVMIRQCGHTFQKDKITQALHFSNKCPICRTRFGRNDLVVNWQLKKVIDRYQGL